MSNDTRHIIILVAGTVDPVCINPSATSRANSNDEKESSNNYWQENPDLIEQLNALCEQHPNLALFDAHGWSGDNTTINREIAGAYLANRLCGSNGEIAYYSGYRNRKVAYHLIGHSHGGNVLNEFTKRAAIAEEWPKQWKIQSVTYLSTPFFKQQHQLNTSTFSADCKIINVKNDFDLTQQVIADFSMYDLVSAINLVTKETPALSSAIDNIKNNSFNEAIGKLRDVFLKPNVIQLIFSSASYKLNKQDGKAIYAQTVNLLAEVAEVLNQLKDIADKLATSLYYPSDSVVKRLTAENSRYFINKNLQDQMNSLLDALIADIHIISSAVKHRSDKSDFSITPLVGDIYPALKRIIKFFRIDEESASGPLIDLLNAVLKNQIEVFDNTTTTPLEQLSTPFRDRLVNINVSSKDPYYKVGDLKGFTQLIGKLEQAEASYERSPTQKNLLRLSITLLAPQIELQNAAQKIKAVNKAMDSFLGASNFSIKRLLVKTFTLRGNVTPIRKLALQLQSQLKTYSNLLQEFDLELLKLEASETTEDSGDNIPVGSLAHFSVVSHSISRQQLYPEVSTQLKSVFEPAITTPEKDGVN